MKWNRPGWRGAPHMHDVANPDPTTIQEYAEPVDLARCPSCGGRPLGAWDVEGETRVECRRCGSFTISADGRLAFPKADDPPGNTSPEQAEDHDQKDHQEDQR